MQENRFQLAGYLAAKPTLRYLPSSMPVANARLGQTYRFTRKDKPSEHTNWFSLVFYGDLAILATELEKGHECLCRRKFRPAALRRPGQIQALYLRSQRAQILCHWRRGARSARSGPTARGTHERGHDRWRSVSRIP